MDEFENRKSAIDEKVNELKDLQTTKIDELNEFIIDFTDKPFLFIKMEDKVKDFKKINKFLKFLEENAEWKYTEAYFLKEVVKTLHNYVESIEKEYKDKTSEEIDDLYLTNRELETINFFLAKVEGRGLKTKTGIKVEDYLIMVNTIQDSLKLTEESKKVMADKKKELDDIAFQMDSWSHGIEPSLT